jgi:hypothetical protein
MLLITVTSGRPTAFNDYLTKWIKHQTYQEYDWLIVSDDSEGYKFPKKAKVVKREDNSELQSMCANWKAALDWIKENGDKYEKFVVIEDDDYYADNFLYEINRMLDLPADLVGFNEDAYYYVLHRRAMRLHNKANATLATTAFKRSVLPLMNQIVAKNQWDIDIQLWKEWKGSRKLCNNFTGLPDGVAAKLDNKGMVANEQPRHVGLKGEWHEGKTNVSEIGNVISGGYDIQGRVAQHWLGDNAQGYLKFTRPMKVPTPFILQEIPDNAI